MDVTVYVKTKANGGIEVSAYIADQVSSGVLAQRRSDDRLSLLNYISPGRNFFRLMKTSLKQKHLLEWVKSTDISVTFILLILVSAI